MEKTLEQCLTEAADLIESSGWVRRDFERRIGEKWHYCLWGALRKVCPKSARERAEDLVDLLGFSRTDGVFQFNDAQESKRPVIARLRAAAKRAKGAAQ